MNEPILPPGVIDEGVLRIDWSGTSKVQECWREAWHLLAHRRVRDYRDSNQAFGQAIHAALDVRQKFGSGPYTMKQVEMMERVIEREFDGVELAEDDYLTEGRAKEVLGLYLQKYPSEDFEILGSEMSGERELGKTSFDLELSDGRKETRPVTIVWQGKTDGIWRDPRDGKVYIKDTKTTKYGGMDTKQSELRMSGQMKGYCFLFSGEKWGEILDAVVDMVVIRAPVARVTAKTLPRTEFHRMPISFTPGVIEEFRADTIKVLSTWLTMCGSRTPPPMSGAPRVCVWPKPCQFLSVCENQTEKDRMAWLMSGEFRENTWDPMTK